MKRKKLTKLFKLGILFFGILVTLWGCEKEEIPIQNKQKNTNNGDGVAKIETISFNQLPKEFIDNYIDYQNKTGTTILSKNNNKEALKREFKEKITKVTAENGVITYNVIPLKKENSNSLRKSNECEDPDPDHSVISMNIGADGTRSDLYQTDFYGIGTPFLNNNNSPNSRFNFFTNVVNLGFGGSLVNNNPSNSNITKCKKRRKGSGGGGLNINFRSFWGWIKGIFRSRGKVMHGGCPTTGIDQEQPGGGFSNMARFDDDLLYDFKIPLEASDFASKTRKTPTIEDFDCACEKDKSLTIAQFLELEFEQMLFLAEDNQKNLRDKICKFVKDNNHSTEAENFVKNAISILSDPLLPLGQNSVGYTAKIQKMITHLRLFGSPEDEIFANYIESLIPDFNSMTVGDVYDIYKLTKEQTDNLIYKYFDAIITPVAEAAYPFIVYALTEATLGAALPLLSRIPLVMVTRGARLNKVILQTTKLGNPGVLNSRLIPSSTVRKVEVLFTSLTKDAINITTAANNPAIKVAHMGNGMKIILRPNSTTVPNAIRVIEYQNFNSVLGANKYTLKFLP